MNRATFVMYHYVRDLTHSRYPGIKGLQLDLFRGQLEYLARHYRFVTMQDCIAAAAGRTSLPPNAVVLTFDDGYLDHYCNVFPILDSMGIQGSFFPPASAILKHELLDVNKIHFVLSETHDSERLLKAVFAGLDRYRAEYGLERSDSYFNALAAASRYDTREIIFVKRLLQTALPPAPRKAIVNDLFREFVGVKESDLAGELYMSVDQIRTMVRHGMFVGSHGSEHFWLNSIPPSQQVSEIEDSLAFLALVGAPVTHWVMCYPYGAYNESLLEALRARGCALGLTTAVDVATLSADTALILPRLDTNDLPKAAEAAPNHWTLGVQPGLTGGQSDYTNEE